MILSYPDLLARLPEIIPDETQRDEALVNPASIDIRIGGTYIREINLGSWQTEEFRDDHQSYLTFPGEFLLVATYEYITVPKDLAIELKLKSSRAREGWNHSLAFWVDPGWAGILTMEIQNITRYQPLPLAYKNPFAQLIVHQLTTPVEKGYQGKYQKAERVERTKGDFSSTYSGLGPVFPHQEGWIDFDYYYHKFPFDQWPEHVKEAWRKWGFNIF